MADLFAAYMTIHVLLAEGRVNPMGKGGRFFKWSALLEAVISKPIESVGYVLLRRNCYSTARAVHPPAKVLWLMGKMLVAECRPPPQ